MRIFELRKTYGLITIAISAISIGFYFLTTGPGNWKLSTESIQAGRYWTLVTYCVTHGSLHHLVYDVLGLLLVGGAVESLAAAQLYFLSLFFLVPGLALFHLWYAPQTAAMGLSGLQQGLFGVLIVLLITNRHFVLGISLAFIQSIKLLGETLGVSSFHQILHRFSLDEGMRVGFHGHWMSFLSGMVLCSIWVIRSHQILPGIEEKVCAQAD